MAEKSNHNDFIGPKEPTGKINLAEKKNLLKIFIQLESVTRAPVQGIVF